MCVLQSSNVKELLLQLQIKIHGVARSVQLYCWTRSGTEERTTASFLGHPIITDEELKMCEHVAKKQSSTDRGGASKGNSQQRTCRHDGSVTLNEGSCPYLPSGRCGSSGNYPSSGPNHGMDRTSPQESPPALFHLPCFSAQCFEEPTVTTLSEPKKCDHRLPGPTIQRLLKELLEAFFTQFAKSSCA